MTESVSSEGLIPETKLSTPKETQNPFISPPKFIYLPELSSEKIGGKVLYSTDEDDENGGKNLCQKSQNLLKASQPVWNDDLCPPRQLDGWETKLNSNSEKSQFCIIQLGIPGVIYGIDVDTAYFIGHHALQVSVLAANLKNSFSSKLKTKPEKDLSSEWTSSQNWTELLTSQNLNPGYQTCCHNYFKISDRRPWTHLRFSLFSGGGVARLRIYGQPQTDLSSIPNGSLMDLLSLQNGGVCVGSNCPKMIRLASNLNYGDQTMEETNSCTMPGDNHLLPIFDLQLLKESEMQVFWAIYRLGHPGIVKKIEMKTGKFDCKYLSLCRLEACCVNSSVNFNDEGFEEEASFYPWFSLLPMTGLLPCTKSTFEITPPRHGGVVTHIRLTLGLISPPQNLKENILESSLKRLFIYGYKCLPPFPKL